MYPLLSHVYNKETMTEGVTYVHLKSSLIGLRRSAITADKKYPGIYIYIG